MSDTTIDDERVELLNEARHRLWMVQLRTPVEGGAGDRIMLGTAIEIIDKMGSRLPGWSDHHRRPLQEPVDPWVHGPTAGVHAGRTPALTYLPVVAGSLLAMLAGAAFGAVLALFVR